MLCQCELLCLHVQIIVKLILFIYMHYDIKGIIYFNLTILAESYYYFSPTDKKSHNLFLLQTRN